MQLGGFNPRARAQEERAANSRRARCGPNLARCPSHAAPSEPLRRKRLEIYSTTRHRKHPETATSKRDSGNPSACKKLCLLTPPHGGNTRHHEFISPTYNQLGIQSHKLTRLPRLVSHPWKTDSWSRRSVPRMSLCSENRMSNFQNIAV